MKTTAARFFLAIFCLALAFRLLLLSGWYLSGNGAHLSGDSTLYVKIAKSLAEGNGFQVEGQPNLRRGPVYPWLLSLASHGSFSLLTIHLFQVMIASLSCLFLMWIAMLLGERQAAVFAGLFLAFDYLLAKQCVYILPEIVFVFLLFGTLGVWFWARVHKHLYGFAAAGLLAGLTVLTKEVLSLYFPVLAIVGLITVRDKAKMLRCTAIFLMAYGLCLMPWVIRNSRIQGQLTFLTNSSGLTFYLGNNPSVNPRWYGGDWITGIDTVYPTEKDLRAVDPAVQPDRWYFQHAVEHIQHHPWIFLKNVGIKAGRLWYPFYHKSPTWAKWVTGLPYAGILILACIGFYSSRRNWRALMPFYLLLVYLTGIHAVTIPGIRYRYPMVPVLMFFAGRGAYQIWLQYRTKRVKIGVISSDPSQESLR